MPEGAEIDSEGDHRIAMAGAGRLSSRWGERDPRRRVRRCLFPRRFAELAPATRGRTAMMPACCCEGAKEKVGRGRTTSAIHYWLACEGVRSSVASLGGD